MKRLGLLLLSTGLLVGVAFAQQQQVSVTGSPAPAGIVACKDVAYVPGGDEDQKLDLYVPVDRSGPFPLIIWIHGGAWKYGSKEGCIPLPWVAKGYAVASINYRLSQEAKFPAQIKDCKAAVRWLRAHASQYKIDRDRFIAWGDSAGGYLASLLGTAGDTAEWEPKPPVESSRVQAVIDWYGRADLTRVCTDPAMATHPVAQLLGGSGGQVAEIARKASPITYVSEDDPPFLIMHGDVDKTVPVQLSIAFAEALKKKDVPVTLVILPGVDHGGSEFLKPEKVSIIDAFLNKYIKRPLRHLARLQLKGQ
jgi:acetyl esterase/lipase